MRKDTLKNPAEGDLPVHLRRKRKHSASTGQGISGDDTALFREAMQDVKPLTKTGKVILSRSECNPPAPVDTSALPAAQDHLFAGGWQLAAEGDEWSFVRPGLQRYTLKKLRRGYWPVQDELDLHGFNRNEAHRALIVFLNGVILLRYRCVRVIHGRGLSSENRKPVLKERVGSWLIQLDAVLAFCQARPEQGGSGAVLVLLRNADK